MYNSNVYYTFLYLGDCLIVVLDSAGGEVLKKQFGMSGEKDILGELILTTDNLYMLG